MLSLVGQMFPEHSGLKRMVIFPLEGPRLVFFDVLLADQSCGLTTLYGRGFWVSRAC